MTKSGKRRNPSPSSDHESRSQTTFERTKQFDKSVAGLGPQNEARALATAQQFQREWKASKTNNDLPPGFNFKQLEAKPGQYRVCQIYAGSDYRLAITFLIGQGRAYWLHAWKKTRMNNRTETELAQARAKSLWDELQRERK